MTEALNMVTHRTNGSKEISNLFHKDRTQFMNLRYNTVEHNAVEPGFVGFHQDFTTPAQ